MGIDRDKFVAGVLYEELYVAEGAGLSQLVKVVPERVGVVSRHHSAGHVTRGFKDTGRKTNVMLLLCVCMLVSCMSGNFYNIL